MRASAGTADARRGARRPRVPARETAADAPRDGGMPRVGEALVARLWQAQHFRRRALRTAEGTCLQIVYPGRRRGERGPDFQEALVSFDGADLRRGGVEVHVRSSDWARHGHQRDPAYNATLLHVVLWHDLAEPVRRADGEAVPTLALAAYLDDPLADLALEPTQVIEWPLAERGACGPDAASVAARLEAAGLARFAARKTRHRAALETGAAADALCTGLIEAMGFGANRAPARELAARLPAAAVQAATAEGAVAGQALLLGVAGLLPSQRGLAADDVTVDALETAWRALAGLAPTPLAAAEWRFHGVRPAGYPPRRLAGLGALLARAPLDRLVADAARALRTLEPRAAARALAAALVTEGTGYWRDHWDFGRASVRPLPAPLGPERAAEIVVIVLLPLLAAWGEVLDDHALGAAARACYLQHPAAGDNERLRHMRRQVLGGADRAVTGTACRQQGLLHVYERTCSWRRCEVCVVGPPSSQGPAPCNAAGQPPDVRARAAPLRAETSR